MHNPTLDTDGRLGRARGVLLALVWLLLLLRRLKGLVLLLLRVPLTICGTGSRLVVGHLLMLLGWGRLLPLVRLPVVLLLLLGRLEGLVLLLRVSLVIRGTRHSSLRIPSLAAYGGPRRDTVLDSLLLSPRRLEGLVLLLGLLLLLGASLVCTPLHSPGLGSNGRLR